ncbi:MAG: lysostaphin resistance A-like protein [Planctomycetota bacterium]
MKGSRNSAAQTLWLILRLRARRLLNFITAPTAGRGGKPLRSAPRTGTGRRGSPIALLVPIALIPLGVGALFYTNLIVRNLQWNVRIPTHPSPISREGLPNPNIQRWIRVWRLDPSMEVLLRSTVREQQARLMAFRALPPEERNQALQKALKETVRTKDSPPEDTEEEALRLLRNNMISKELDRASRAVGAEKRYRRSTSILPPLSEPALRSRTYARYTAGIITVLALAFLFAGIGAGTVQLDASVAWFLTLPVSVLRIYTFKVVELTFLNLFAWFFFWPMYGWVLAYWGYGVAAIPIGLVLALLTQVLIALLLVVIEILLRRFFSAYMIRAAQGAAYLLFMFLFLFAAGFMVPGRKGAPEFIYSWLAAVGIVAEVLPPGLLLGILRNPGGGPVEVVLLLAELVVLFGAGAILISKASSRGLEAIQGGIQGRRGTKVRDTRPWPTLLPGAFAAVMAKDLRALLRDKVFFIQVGVVPLFIIGMQLMMNPKAIHDFMGNAVLWGVFAFGIGAYTLIFAGPTVLYHERDALWVFYTIPRALTVLFVQKAGVWILLAGAYALGAFGIGIAVRGTFGLADVTALAWIVFGIPLWGMVCSGVGILGTDPFSKDPRRRVPFHINMFLFFLLGLFVGGYFLPGPWPKTACLVLFASLAFGMWQKVHRTQPYLLDPTAVPPRRVDLVDGMIAILLFFFVNQVFLLILMLGFRMDRGAAVVVSYSLAGILIVALALLILNLRRIVIPTFLPFWRGKRWKSVLVTSVVGTAITTGIGIAYLGLIHRFVPESLTSSFPIDRSPLLLLGIVAAPLFEEILFRGFVFKGLRMSMRFFPAAVVSALLFTFVHPPLSAVPVFCLGLTAAWAYEKSKVLVAPILIHGLYNAIVLFIS